MGAKTEILKLIEKFSQEQLDETLKLLKGIGYTADIDENRNDNVKDKSLERFMSFAGILSKEEAELIKSQIYKSREVDNDRGKIFD